jgi:hypothetical protein
MSTVMETDLAVGPSAIDAYSRLSYTMWHALAEFIDNSTQSRLNYGSTVDDVLKQEGRPLTIEIEHNRLRHELRISDNSIGMNHEDLIAALRIAHPTKDSRGRSKYGMGMKTSACWIGRRWRVITCEWGSGEEWTADIDVDAIAHRGAKVPLSKADVARDQHYTHIVISDLHRNIQKRTEENICAYLGSMYRFDLQEGRLRLLYNGTEIKGPEAYDFDTDPEGRPMRLQLPNDLHICGKKVSGWVAVLKKGGRKFGGFSIFQNSRQIQGYPNAWKPREIFGGFDEEGANNLIAQRLTGVLEMDGFDVSHTKDAMIYRGDEEQELVTFLEQFTRDYRNYAQRRRGARGQPWSREKVKDLLDSMKKEFTSGEMKDAITHAMLPPIDTIIANNKQQVASLTEAEKLATIELMPELRVVVSLQEKSQYEPYVNIVAGADAGTIHVIINGLHPYYSSLESTDAMDECIRQYIYDALAEYRVSKLNAKVTPESVRRLKNDLLQVQVMRLENAAAAAAGVTEITTPAA